MVPTRPRLSSVAMAPSRNPRDTRALGRAGGRARAGGQSRGCLRPAMPGKENESGRARVGEGVVRCVPHPVRLPSSSLRFPLPREPEREGEAPFRGRCPPVTTGGGSAHRAGLAGNWKVKLCGKLEREALVGVGADAAAPGLCGQRSGGSPAFGRRSATVPSAQRCPRPGELEQTRSSPGRAMEGSGREPPARHARGGARGEGAPGNAGQEGWVWCWYRGVRCSASCVQRNFLSRLFQHFLICPRSLFGAMVR